MELRSLVKVTLSGSGGTWAQASLILGPCGPLGGVFPACPSSLCWASALPGMMLCYSFCPQHSPLHSEPHFCWLWPVKLPCLTPMENPLFLVTLFGSNTFLGKFPACIFLSAVLDLLGTVHSLNKHCSPYRKLHIYVSICIQFLGLTSILKTSVSLPSRLME